MKLIVVPDKDELGRTGGRIIAQEIRSRRFCKLGLATGETPIPVYQELIRLHAREGLDFSRVITFNLDEYAGLPPAHEQSYRRFMNQRLFDHVNIPIQNTHTPDGMAQDIEKHCAEYEEWIASVGGLDLQILGIGANGHIGFNEPGGSLASRTRLVTLAPQTIRDNARFFGRSEDVPKTAITVGVGTMLEASRIVLFASGATKAAAVAAAIQGPVSAMCPASALQTHPSATFVITKDAASQLSLNL